MVGFVYKEIKVLLPLDISLHDYIYNHSTSLIGLYLSGLHELNMEQVEAKEYLDIDKQIGRHL